MSANDENNIDWSLLADCKNCCFDGTNMVEIVNSLEEGREGKENFDVNDLFFEFLSNTLNLSVEEIKNKLYDSEGSFERVISKLANGTFVFSKKEILDGFQHSLEELCLMTNSSKEDCLRNSWTQGEIFKIHVFFMITRSQFYFKEKHIKFLKDYD